jgi:hypothetical protein
VYIYLPSNTEITEHKHKLIFSIHNTITKHCMIMYFPTGMYKDMLTLFKSKIIVNKFRVCRYVGTNIIGKKKKCGH